ncbi:4343_t:CDS:1 [Ambispora leptoticha]|uniref:4343_t:CDS:1 n=1 Tax=Ambispora leptoticha TaxID=144679 RepID=A0A9N9FGQ9_9GLOM|nr:4343_t:CDS:1 [Ambispora leptoticha]
MSTKMTSNNNNTSTSTNTRDVKISFNSIVRRFIVPKDITWHDFEDQIRKRFLNLSPQPIFLSYKDEDGDIITLSSTEELSEVLASNNSSTIAFSMSFAGYDPNTSWIFERGEQQQQRSSAESSISETASLIDLSENEEQAQRTESKENSNLINEQDQRRQQPDQERTPFNVFSTAGNITNRISDLFQENFDEWILFSGFGQEITLRIACGSNNTQSQQQSNESGSVPLTDGNIPLPPHPPTDPPHRRPPGSFRSPHGHAPTRFSFLLTKAIFAIIALILIIAVIKLIFSVVFPVLIILFLGKLIHRIHGRGGRHRDPLGRHGFSWGNHHHRRHGHPPPPPWW